MIDARRFAGRARFPWIAAAAALMLGALTGCENKQAVRVDLHERSLPTAPVNVLEIQAQVAGPLDGLHYKWFAVSGQCQPQESDEPETVFRFLEGVRQDKVSVEVWRKGVRVAQSDLKVKFHDDGGAGEISAPELNVEITTIPPAEPGGSDTHADIGGKVEGHYPRGSLIVLYARAYGYWYVQPGAGALIGVRPDNTWWSWTHTGSKYAALLVRPDYEPVERIEMLPQTNAQVFACAIVNGIIKDATNAPVNGGTH